MLVSVHIPKTGGTSLLHLLKKKYGKRLRRDYPDLPVKLDRRLKALVSRPPLAVHGHFPASKYAGTKITFLRDPLERRISSYHYIYRHHEQHGYVANEDWKFALASSLDTYVATANSDYQHFLDVPEEEFAFVGQMSRFDQDMELLSDALEIPFEKIAANKAPKPTEASGELRKKFERANPGEMDVYDRFVKRAEELLTRPILHTQETSF